MAEGLEVPLREYFESQIESLKREFDLRLLNMENNVKTASLSMNERLAGMNEFRESMKDQAAKFVTNAVLDAKVETLSEKIGSTKVWESGHEGKATTAQLFILAAPSIIAIILMVITIFLNNK